MTPLVARPPAEAPTTETLPLGGLATGVIALYAFVVPLGSGLNAPIGVPLVPDTLSTVVGAMAMLMVLPTVLAAWAAGHRPVPATWLWTGFLGLAALGYSWSVNRGATLDDLVVLSSLVVLSVLTVAMPWAPRHLHRLRVAIVGSGAVAGLLATYQAATGTLAESGTGTPRFELISDDPNVTAAALMLPAALALAVALDRGGPAITRLSAAVAAGLTASALVFTASRGGLVGFGVVVLVLVHRRWGWRRVVAVAALGALIWIVVPLPAGSRAAGSTGRDSIWQIALVGCEKHCWLGSGLGTFPDVHESVALDRPELANLELRFEAHNLWLGSLIELGMVATLLLAVIVAAAWRAAAANRSPLGLGALGGLAGVVATNLFVANLEFKYFWLAIVVATLAGTTGNAAPRGAGIGKDRHRVSRRPPFEGYSFLRSLRASIGWAVLGGLVGAFGVVALLWSDRDDRSEVRAIVVAQELVVNTDELSASVDVIYRSGGVGQRAVEIGGLDIDPRSLTADAVGVVVVETTPVIQVVARHDDPIVAARYANAVAAALVQTLNEARGVGTFALLERADPASAQSPSSLPMLPLALLGAVVGASLAAVAAHLLRRPVYSLRELQAVSGAPVAHQVRVSGANVDDFAAAIDLGHTPVRLVPCGSAGDQVNELALLLEQVPSGGPVATEARPHLNGSGEKVRFVVVVPAGAGAGAVHRAEQTAGGSLLATVLVHD